MKSKAIVVCFSLYILLGEVHNFFKSSGTNNADVFLLLDYSLDVQWIVKQVSEKLQSVCLALVCWLASRGQLKKFALLVLLFSVFDVMMYFVNYNSNPVYTVVYLALSLMLLKIFKV